MKKETLQKAKELERGIEHCRKALIDIKEDLGIWRGYVYIVEQDIIELYINKKKELEQELESL